MEGLFVTQDLKVRHLKGISLRNLNFSSLSEPSAQGQSLAESQCAPSRPTPNGSFTKDAKLSETVNGVKLMGEENGDASKLSAPPLVRSRTTRRRSDLNWSNTTPMTRQHTLEDVSKERLADVWFNIDCHGLQVPIYVSEIKPKAINPDFAFFELNSFGDAVTSQDNFVLRCYAKTEDLKEYRLFIEDFVDMNMLVWIARSLENYDDILPENCVLYHAVDGVYRSCEGPAEASVIMTDAQQLPSIARPLNVSATKYSASFDALMKLQNHAQCISDSLETRDDVVSKINSLITDHKLALATITDASAIHESGDAFSISAQTVTNANLALRKRKKEIKTRFNARRVTLEAAIEAEQLLQENLLYSKAKLQKEIDGLREVEKKMIDHARRIANGLDEIFPIEPIEGKTQCFTICEVYLPNSNSLYTDETATEDNTATALGFVAALISQLSFTLGIALPYPVTPKMSSSTIFDPISVNGKFPTVKMEVGRTPLETENPARVFPLFQKGNLQWKVAYGVYLLNKDLEVIMSKYGLRVLDPRATLGNLKYLMNALMTPAEVIKSRVDGFPNILGDYLEHSQIMRDSKTAELNDHNIDDDSDHTSDSSTSTETSHDDAFYDEALTYFEKRAYIIYGEIVDEWIHIESRPKHADLMAAIKAREYKIRDHPHDSVLNLVDLKALGKVWVVQFTSPGSIKPREYTAMIRSRFLKAKVVDVSSRVNETPAQRRARHAINSKLIVASGYAKQIEILKKPNLPLRARDGNEPAKNQQIPTLQQQEIKGSGKGKAKATTEGPPSEPGPSTLTPSIPGLETQISINLAALNELLSALELNLADHPLGAEVSDSIQAMRRAAAEAAVLHPPNGNHAKAATLPLIKKIQKSAGSGRGLRDSSEEKSPAERFFEQLDKAAR